MSIEDDLATVGAFLLAEIEQRECGGDRAYMRAALEACEAFNRIVEATREPLAKLPGTCPKSDVEDFGREPYRVTAWRELAAERDALIKENASLLSVLRECVALYGKPGGPWNVPSDPGGWISRARAVVETSREPLAKLPRTSPEPEWLEGLA